MINEYETYQVEKLKEQVNFLLTSLDELSKPSFTTSKFNMMELAKDKLRTFYKMYGRQDEVQSREIIPE